MNGSTKDILKKYENILNEQTDPEEFSDSNFSRDYEIFRQESLSTNMGLYERLCNFSEKILTVKAKEQEREKLQRSINICHLNINPDGATSFAALFSILIIFIGLLIGLTSFLLGNLMVFLPLIIIITGGICIKLLAGLPNYFANKWRLEASNQMVLCILYVVMYMRHTSNLERAIKFSSEHISGNLSLDFKKVFWDVEVGKYVTIKESLDNYLESWREWNIEFIESFHLIESSLYESQESRRVEVLEKALEVMLQGTFDKMMHYAQNLKSPITTLHMLGVILPILGLVILPLAGSFLQGLIKWYHIAILYDIILPVLVMALGYNVLLSRPTGYGEAEVLKEHPEFKKYENVYLGNIPISTLFIGILIGSVILLVGLLPIIIHYLNPAFDMNIFKDTLLEGKFLDYKGDIGPYGLGAALFSLLIPLGIAIGLGIHYKLKTKTIIKVKREIDNLENEFSGSLFQLGNRVGDNIPVELAFGQVAENMKDSPSGNFFRLVSDNIKRFGMDVKNAIFNNERGAILSYPSSLIESSMKILVESAKKSPQVVAKSLITFSEYVNRIRSVNERLKDLLSDIISSMQSQINFLTPIIAGIVIGVASMVVTIINKLGEQFSNLSTDNIEGMGGLGGLVNIMRIQDVIPTYQFQLVVGLYVVEITIILTILANSIERGIDKLNLEYNLGKNLIRSVSMYFIISLLGILAFNALANIVNMTAAAP